MKVVVEGVGVPRIAHLARVGEERNGEDQDQEDHHAPRPCIGGNGGPRPLGWAGHDASVGAEGGLPVRRRPLTISAATHPRSANALTTAAR